MEVEFLSNMRYNLLASKEQWQEWQGKLGKFWTYCDKATRPYPSPLPNFQTNLSPPNSTHSSPPSAATLYPPTSYAPNWSSHNYTAPLISPLPAMPDLDVRTRKRAYEGDNEDPPAKRERVTRPLPSSGPVPSFAPKDPVIRHDGPRLPVPNLTISTSQPYTHGYNGANGYPQHVPLLPPLSGRSMSTVFPTTPTWTPQLPNPQLPMLTPTGSNSNGSHHNIPNTNGYHTPSRRTSPHSVHDLLSLGSSPVSANYQQNYNSPSFYLQQRASPYKPVRHVNTLLYPPPSASMHDYSVMNASQMHYQPLGKRNDYRQGIAYPSNNQNQWTLPQPNFHA